MVTDARPWLSGIAGGDGEGREVQGGGTCPEPPRPRRSGAGRHLPALKWILAIAVLGAFGYLLVRVRGTIATALHQVGPGGLPWLALAVVAEAASFLCYAGVQRRLLAAGGARIRRTTMVGLTAAATGLTNLVPGGTAPASGWLVAQYRRRGVPLSLAMWSVLAGGFAAGVSVLFLLACGAAVAGLVGPGELAGLLVALAAAAAAGVACFHRMLAVRRWLDRDHRVAALRRARRLAERAGVVVRFRATARGGAVVYALSTANWVLDVAVLAAGFAGLGLTVPWRSLLFAYAAAQVAGALSPLPGGIGFVEGGMIGAFTLAGAPTGSAVVATVVYRLVTTLGMAALGAGALLVVNHRPLQPAELSGEAAALAARDPLAHGDAVAGRGAGAGDGGPTQATSTRSSGPCGDVGEGARR